MHETSQLSTPRSHDQRFGPALVVDSDEPNRLVRVRLESMPEAGEFWATVAVSEAPAKGDRVVVAGGPGEEAFVIGVLMRRAGPARLATGSGAWAETDGDRNLKVFSKRGELLFEYDPVAEKTRVTTERGDLEFVSRDGSISFRAAGDVRLGGRAVELTGRTGVRMGVLDARGVVRTALSLTPRKTRLASPKVEVQAERGRFELERTSFDGEQVEARVSRTKFTGERLETVVQTVIQKARNLFRTVRELAQLKTGRRRVLVDEDYHLQATTSRMRTSKDFKVDGERILLG